MSLPPSVEHELSWPERIGRGDRNGDVRRVQEWLCLHNFSVKLDGDFGPATEAALRRFQTLHSLTADGFCSAETLNALTRPLRSASGYIPPTRDPRRAVVACAEAHAKWHPREVGGDNRGPWVRAYCGRDGIDYKWCAGSALSIVRQAFAGLGAAMPVPFTLSCDALGQAARKARRLTTTATSAHAGDLFLVRGKAEGDWVHVGIVTGVHLDHLETIEGNTNDDGSPNGYELVPRRRGLMGKDFVLLGA